MGIVESVVENKEEILIKLIEVLSGKEAKAAVNLDGVTFNVGENKVIMEGAVRFTVIAADAKKKQKK